MDYSNVKPFWNAAEWEIITKLRPMIEGGQLTPNLESGKYKCRVSTVDLDVSYLFFGDKSRDDCVFYWDIFYHRFGLIPSHCEGCWKIVVDFPTVADLFLGYDLLSETGLHGKAGVDTREYTTGMYKAFIYNEAPESEQNYVTVRTLMDETFGGTVKTILKRGCTEFEMKADSTRWNASHEQRAYEQLILSFFEPITERPIQPDWLVRFKKHRWITEASKVGDLSFKKLPGLENLITAVKSRQYHKEEWMDGR